MISISRHGIQLKISKDTHIGYETFTKKIQRNLALLAECLRAWEADEDLPDVVVSCQGRERSHNDYGEDQV